MTWSPKSAPCCVSASRRAGLETTRWRAASNSGLERMVSTSFAVCRSSSVSRATRSITWCCTSERLTDSGSGPASTLSSARPASGAASTLSATPSSRRRESSSASRPVAASTSTRPRTNGSPSTMRTGQSIDLPAVAPARLTVTASPTTTLRPFVGSVAIVLP